AEGRFLKHAIAYKQHLLKPNEKEFLELIGIENPTGEIIISEAKKLLALGIREILISRGDKGSMLIISSWIYESKGIEVEMKSTVGAGDSMVAALVYSEINSHDDGKTLGMAESAGIAAVMKEGSEPCTLDEIMKIFDDVEKYIEIYVK
ncbi:MAG: PfkB family carbohydrate kinase, partial [Clostridiaceae bacterium]